MGLRIGRMTQCAFQPRIRCLAVMRLRISRGVWFFRAHCTEPSDESVAKGESVTGTK